MRGWGDTRTHVPSGLATPGRFAYSSNEMSKQRQQHPQRQAIQLRSAIPSAVKPFTVKMVRELTPDRGKDPRLKFTPPLLTKIFNEIANCGVMRTACAAAAVSLGQFLRLREVHEEIDELTKLAIDFYRERIQETIHNRAIEGWDEPVFYQGRPVGSIRKFSDRLLELQAKRFCPEYRDRSEVDVNVSGGVLVIHSPAMGREDWLAERRKRLAIAGEAESIDGEEAERLSEKG